VAVRALVMPEMQYDTIEQFYVDRKTECGQLNLAHITKKQLQKQGN